jgi:hypothetical protein
LQSIRFHRSCIDVRPLGRLFLLVNHSYIWRSWCLLYLFTNQIANLCHHFIRLRRSGLEVFQLFRKLPRQNFGRLSFHSNTNYGVFHHFELLSQSFTV